MRKCSQKTLWPIILIGIVLGRVSRTRNSEGCHSSDADRRRDTVDLLGDCLLHQLASIVRLCRMRTDNIDARFASAASHFTAHAEHRDQPNEHFKCVIAFCVVLKQGHMAAHQEQTTLHSLTLSIIEHFLQNTACHMLTGALFCSCCDMDTKLTKTVPARAACSDILGPVFGGL